MTLERWEQIKEMVKRQYSVEDEGTEDLLVETGEGMVKQGEAEFIIFDAPSALGGGRMKLELQKKPRLEEKKYHFSHRQGDAARVEYKFSDSETVLQLKAYKEDEDGEWKEIDAASFAGN